jgi:hypothetical protein
MFSIGAIKKLSFFAEKYVDLFYVILKQRRFQMKRTCFVLVSLLAITLLSCSALDNSAEDVNYPQDNALSKAGLDVATAMATTGSAKLTSGVSWYVAGVGVGSTKWSNELYFKFTTPPASCTITKIEFCPGAVSVNKGTFEISRVDINNKIGYMPLSWKGTGCVSTDAFYGEPVRNEFTVDFFGKCTYGYYEFTSVYVPQCNKSYSGGNMTIYYECP